MKRLLWEGNGYGPTVLGAMAIFAAAIILLVVGIVGACYALAEKNCNATVERLSSPLVADGDFDFWANECYVETTDGRFIPFSQHRTFEKEELIK